MRFILHSDERLRGGTFNLYFERDPSLDPNGFGCPNPASLKNWISSMCFKGRRWRRR